MALRSPACSSAKRSVLARLASDTHGNALAMMAMAIFPLAGLVGGGVDMSRLYLSKTRLQQACDAGALAGRKVMGGGTWTADSGAANTTALQFFDQNFADGAYGTNTRTRAFTEAAGKVTGTASVVLPMTIMKIFGASARTLSVTCDAEMRLPHTDVMFVLDMSGTMSQPIPGDTQTKIVALKTAVKCFYEAVARLNTTATCGTANPSGGVGTQTQVRFGFVNYDHKVNVGKLLPAEYFADSWPYQSREKAMTPQNYQHDTGTTTTEWPSGTGTITESNVVNRGTPPAFATYSGGTTDKTPQANCTVPADDAFTLTGGEGPIYDQTVWTVSGDTRSRSWKRDTSAKYEYEYQRPVEWNSSKSGTCTRRRRTTPATRVRTYTETQRSSQVPVYETRTRNVFNGWTYKQVTHDIRALKNGSSWNASFTLPIGDTAAGALAPVDKPITWDGCIEERETEKLTDYSAMTNAQFEKASDLDIDELPVATDASTLWGPALPDATYTRKRIVNPNTDPSQPRVIGAWDRADILTDATTNYTNNAPYFCPQESRKLAVWNDATIFENYVDALTPNGRTHHDIGLLWGARFMSPTGIFASENALTTTPAGGQISRHMIYMTDGETCTHPYDYTSYGAVWFEKRQTTAENPTGNSATCLGTDGDLTTQVDKRFEYLCTAAKSKNITLWVVYFGVTPAAGQPDTPIVTRMKNCATDTTKYKPAGSAVLLQDAFDSIASQISQLRLTL